MGQVMANGIRIEYETFGRREDPTLMLIAGNGAGLNFWEPEFCRALSGSGFFVLRFDNRDAGLSAHFADRGIPDMTEIYRLAAAGESFSTAYRLADMAADAAGLLSALGIRQAYIVGASMGGMIAQLFACLYPKRTLGLISMMSSTGNPDNPQPKPETIALFTTALPKNKKDYMTQNLAVWRKLWSRGYPFEEERALRYLNTSYDRGYDPGGMLRQNAALIADGDRRSRLRRLQVPALIIHGTADPLIPFPAGEDTARTIPGAKLVAIPGMGHDMPKGTWPLFIKEIQGLKPPAYRCSAGK